MAKLSRRELKREVDWRARDITLFIGVQEKARTQGSEQRCRPPEGAARCRDARVAPVHTSRAARQSETEAFLRRAKEQQKEQQALRAEERRILEAGYRALATKNHPDVGGSHDAMVRLNAAAKQLRKRYKK